jgi:replicative DNA helicase
MVADKMHNIATDVGEVVGHFDMLKPHNRPDVLVTPFSSLNRACRGFGAQKGLPMGWYVVIGGDTGQGKSLLALQLGVAAHEQRFRVGFVSLEMSLPEIKSRFYAQRIGIEASRLEPGDRYDPTAEDLVLEWQGKHADETGGGIPFWAADRVGPDLEDVMDLMHEWLEMGVSVFVVDYLQLMESVDGVGTPREVQKISKMMRDFAHHNGVLVIALSQYNNEGGNDRQNPPHVGHLYGGRRISQDTDLTIMLDHSRVETDGLQPYLSRTFLLVPKNRNGPKGFEIPLLWDYRFLKAREGMPDETKDWPTHGVRKR